VAGTDLLPSLLARGGNTVVVSGGETDICVLMLGAVDAGLRVLAATDALCSSVNNTHDAIINFYCQRLREQIETAEVQEGGITHRLPLPLGGRQCNGTSSTPLPSYLSLNASATIAAS
jgi:hypothetical protein